MTDGVYRHTQRGTWLLAIFAAAIFILVVISSFQGWRWTSAIVLMLLLIIAFLFPSLTVEVGDGRVRCWFGSGLIGRTFDLTEITGVKAVRNRWYYGWGIRYTPYGWLFNISGLDAVELTLRSGKHFRIGTDEPDKLVLAIRQMTGLED
jgi:energy-coupling factor transporter transmembrane protein EcfT